MLNQTTSHRGLIAWFASNPVAANLLMCMILIAGIWSSLTIRKQTSPDFELNSISVQVSYLGAAPEEVEEGVVVKIEEAVQDITGIDDINSVSNEGSGRVTLTLGQDADIDEVLSETKTRVDAIATFPGLAEKPVIYKNEVPVPVLFVSLYGDLDEYSRKLLAQNLRDDLMALPVVNQVESLGDRAYEISIEVSEQTLSEYRLTMSEISEAIRASSVDLPGGTIKSSGGDILLRTEGQVYLGRDYGDLVLRTFADGTRLTLGEIATITDGFVEQDGFGRFNGEPTAIMRILASSAQNELKTSAEIKEFIAKRREELPAGVKLDVWVDRAHYLRGRLDMMLSNMFQGALLVFLVLTLFLRLKVALWVIVGIPITFFGAIALMPHGPWPVSINMISLFGFILVLGIVVDDAIIIGESVYTKIRADGHTLDNVIAGTQRVAVAATFGVLTTIAAFAPLLLIDNIFSPFFQAMSVVVCLCLLFSLVESKLILPAHLAHTRIAPVNEEEIFSPYSTTTPLRRVVRFFQRIQRRFQRALQALIFNHYRPLLQKAIDYRGITITVFIGMLLVTAGLVAGGFTRIVFFPTLPGDFVRADLTMQSGTAPSVRNEVMLQIESSMLEFNAEYQKENPGTIPPVAHVAAFTNGDIAGSVVVELPKDEAKPFSVDEVKDVWRERIGDIPGVKDLEFSGGGRLGGDPLSFGLSGNDLDQLTAASYELAEKLSTYAGVFDITNSATSGAEEIRLRIKPAAEALGITQASLGRQVRQAFFGEEAQRIQRGNDELKVMVRYPLAQRRSVADLEEMSIRTATGDEVPFGAVADIEFGQAFSTISRLNRKRTMTVSADIDERSVEPAVVTKEIREAYMPGLLVRYPGVEFELQGASEEERELVGNLILATLASLILIYTLIAIPLKSYIQPLIIMAVIPFGLIGAIVGHIIFGVAISAFSVFGIVALSGVVVNDSLIMMDFINKARAAGESVMDAVINSGTLRFRAIILTSVTTALGLMPIIFETSTQAQFVIPMAISLSFGILFATVITLFLIPSLYVWQLDVKRTMGKLWDIIRGHDSSVASDTP